MTPYTVRQLPEAEWPRLQHTGMALAQIQQAATTGGVFVVEDEGEIIACGSVMLCAHVEGVWIHEDYRRMFAIGRRLVNALKAAVVGFGARGALGARKIDGRQFVMEMKHARD